MRKQGIWILMVSLMLVLGFGSWTLAEEGVTDTEIHIESALCIGDNCAICQQVCPKDAIRAALLAAAIGTLLWEVFKRIFAFYVAHFSAIGIVLSRFLQGTLTSMIFFLLWITISLIILLWGAELASVVNERIDEKAA